MFVKIALTEKVLDALDALVDGVLRAGQIEIISMSGCEQAAACLELLVVRRGSGAKAPRGVSELQ
eukprot:1585827-Pyramimonas_sp.AAC.1